MIRFITDFAAEYGGVAGVCSAERLDIPEDFYSGFTPFIGSDREKRINPSLVLPGAKSVIAVCLPHKVPELSTEGAVLSSLGSFDDYHKRFKAILHELTAELRTAGDIRCKVLVDSGSLDERAFAARAGICFTGRNGMAISELGSFINIGLLVTDIPLSRFNTEADDFPVTDKAGLCCPPGCRKCVEACPGNAIAEGRPLNVLRCASYITQKEGDLTPEDREIMRRNLYGCDICRDVCPFNKKTPRVKTPGADPYEWLSMPDEQLADLIKNTAMAWKGPALLKRNAQAVRDAGY